MPEELKKEEPMVDVGETEGAEIDLEKDNSAPEQKEELQVEQVPDSGEDTTQETEETKEEAPQKEELEQYSEGVKKRIAKLTRKMREAERQKEEAIAYAEEHRDQLSCASDVRGASVLTGEKKREQDHKICITAEQFGEILRGKAPISSK